ncbi:MAG: hypothetical protein PHV34_03060 [Verrucomicrobiae bacterium]|nr:hypothetical protein [Verrucomicrobiae bacterium]
MSKPTDIRPIGAELYFLPVHMRVPLKFGAETIQKCHCGRVRIRVRDAKGREADGWGETPLSAAWVWPSKLSYDEREKAMMDFCRQLAKAWSAFDSSGHPMEVGHDFMEKQLPRLHQEFNRQRAAEPMPWLGALVCCSLFDLALHDAYGALHQTLVYDTYHAGFMNRDLASYLEPASDTRVSFARKYPRDFFQLPAPQKLTVWHLVGGKDPLDPSELDGSEPKDGYPSHLVEWIQRDGLKCLKIKLRGNDEAWDYDRLAKVGRIGIEQGVHWLSTDFNCMVTDPAYVNRILDRLLLEHPRIYGMILYVEQPFPYELEEHQIDVHSVSARKPLFMDESAHDWRLIKLGRQLGWTGVALKTCKTQTGALLSLCWAKAHGMTLMVQDLTNPMLAQIPHVLLAAHVGTIMGVESNAMQFWPDESKPEAAVHPGLYQRRNGILDLATIRGPGFGYRMNEIRRQLPAST